jgi:hypothetical protein
VLRNWLITVSKAKSIVGQDSAYSSTEVDVHTPAVQGVRATILMSKALVDNLEPR